MKKSLKVLCAIALMLPFAACTPENVGPNGNDDNNYSTLILGTWQVDMMSVDGQDMTPPNMQLSFYDNGQGLMDDGDPGDHNDFTWVINDNVINVNTGNHQFSFTIDTMTATECAFHGNYIEFDGNEITGDIRFHMTKVNGDNPGGGGDPDPGDLGIGTPELWENTETSLTIHAHITGSVDQYLPQFPNYSCGLIWCQASDGTPAMSSNIYTATGDDIYYVIENLTPGTEYNVAAWLKLTPDSEPIISEVRTYSTENASGSGDTNWININSAIPVSSTTISVTVTGYFDNNPNGIGVVYGTSANPTVADNVYNAFEHILNLETGETDATIQRMVENSDGSRTVAVLLNNLQPGATYYLRGYMTFGNGLPTIYHDEVSVTMPTE